MCKTCEDSDQRQIFPKLVYDVHQMVQLIKMCSLDTGYILPLDKGLEPHIFQNVVMLHIKLKKIGRKSTCKQKESFPLGWGQRLKRTFHKVAILHIKLN